MSTVDVRGVLRASPMQIWVPLGTLWLIWGSTYLGIALVLESMPTLLANALRFFAAAAIIATALAIVKGPRILRVSLPEFAYSTLMGCLLLGVGIGTLALAERFVPTGIAALLISITPLWIVLLRFKSGDRPSTLTLTGVIVGLIGLGLMVLPGGTTPRAGTDGDVILWSCLLLTSSFCWAFFSWKSTSYPLPSNSIVTTFYELVGAGAMLLGLGALHGETIHFETFTQTSWVGWIWLVVASVVGYSAYSYLIANAPMSLVSTYAYVNPAIAVLLGALIISEPITLDVVIGLTIVLGGVLLVTTGERES
ncbi:MAG: EamA family transporter [Actinobacteria bacterium]|nr:MAG: EamA family transporter [Actinomycetota bacterium]